MFRSVRWSSPAGVLIFVVAEAFGSNPARAQFPVFFGDQVLTPYGQRNSDGSYRPGVARRWNFRALSPRRNAFSMPQYRTPTYRSPSLNLPRPRSSARSISPRYRYYYPPTYSYSPYYGTTSRPYYGGGWR